MSGIVGIWNLDRRPVEEGVLAGMSATLAHRGPDGEGRWIEGPIGLACQLLRVTPEAAAETQPLVHASGAVLVFDGRLDNREELLASLKASPGLSPDSPDPALVLAAYEAFGERFAERLNGDFALGLFDPTRQQLLLARDAIGIRPLYYCRTGDTFLFASEIKALLAHPQVSSRPNEVVLAKYLLHGSPPEYGLTCFAGISNLPPAHLALLTPGGVLTRRYWDFDPARQTRLGSFQEYAEAFRHHFEQAVRRRLRSAYPVAVSVSGGLDSSSVFCLAETLRRRGPNRYPSIFGLSYTSTDGSPSDENVFVREIERAYGLEIHHVPMQVGFLNGCREALWHVEIPMLDEQGNTAHAFLEAARHQGARVLLTGHWGDELLFNQAYLIDLFRRPAWGDVWAHLKELGWWRARNPRFIRASFLPDLVRYHLPDLLVPFLRRFRAEIVRPRFDRPWYTEEFRELARQRASMQARLGGAFATAHARALYQEARSTGSALFMEYNNKLASMHGLEMAFPFLDRDLISFLIAIPGEMQTWKGVPKAILREAMRGVLPDAIAHRTWKASFDHLDIQGIEREYPDAVQCLEEEGSVVRLGYVKGDVMRAELARLKDRIHSPSNDVSTRVADLLGVDLWLQVFLRDANNGHNFSGSFQSSSTTPGGSG